VVFPEALRESGVRRIRQLKPRQPVEVVEFDFSRDADRPDSLQPRAGFAQFGVNAARGLLKHALPCRLA
jgi:hypothetical protein